MGGGGPKYEYSKSSRYLIEYFLEVARDNCGKPGEKKTKLA